MTRSLSFNLPQPLTCTEEIEIMTTTVYPQGVTYTSDTLIVAGDEVQTPWLYVSPNGIHPTILTNRGTLTIGSSTRESNGVSIDPLAGFVNEGLVRSTDGAGWDAYGVSSHTDLPVINRGTIQVQDLNHRAIGVLTGSNLGVFENSGRIEVTSGSADAYGIWNMGMAAHITNSGTILIRGRASVPTDPLGVTGIRSGQSSGVLINNSGTIDLSTNDPDQPTVGIYLFPDGTNIHSYATVVNSGTIIATTAIKADNGYQTAIHVRNSGHITGDLILNHNLTIVHNEAGADWTGHLQFGTDDDVLVNAGSIVGVVDLDAGDDLYDGHGSGTAQTVHAGAGMDVLIGGNGVDQFDGGDGRDFIYAGAGSDLLTGGAGADIFVYRATGDSTAAAPDTITDFASGQDRIDLSALAPTNVTITDQGAMHLVTAETAQGSLVIQVSGSIAMGDLLLTAPAAAIDGTANADLLYAGSGPSNLNGLAGDDLLIGGAGNDRLDGGTGADRAYGGAGDDVYIVDDLYDRIYEAPGEGHDSVYSYAEFAILKDDVEDLYLMAGALDGAGNDGNNVIVGNTLDNHLWGRGGVDQLYGGGGNDSYYVDRSDDLVFEAAGDGIDTIYASCSFYLYDNVENLFLGSNGYDFKTSYSFDPTAIYFAVGNSLDNRMGGDQADNLLLGGAGADTISGNNGNDSIFGETGDDTLYGNEGIDYIVGGDGNDLIYGGNGADALYGGAGDDHLIGHREYIRDQITGLDTVQSDFSTDILVGGDGNDILDGASGLGDYDLMDGGAGDDAYYVDTPADLTFEAVGSGADTVYANIKGAGYYLYANVENLVLQGNTPYGVGNELDNHLTGNAIGNYLLGGAGNDVLNGKGGNDVLFGEAGTDTFVFEHGTGGDVIGDFLAGADKIDLSAFGFANFQAVVNSMHEVNGTTAIDLGGGDFIVLNGVAEATLHAGDFILGGGASANVPAVNARVHDTSWIDTTRSDHFASMPALVHAGDLFI
jgi:Ca2+-binding RTX toxin-like protein